MKTSHSTLLGKVLAAFLLAGLPAVNTHASDPEFKTEPDKTMAAAHESFIKGDTKKAGEEIDKAADYVKKQSRHVAEGSKADMEKAGEELNKLGEGVKSGSVKSEAELKKTFAKVNHQIANCWHKTAEETHKMGKDSKADLKKAGDHLEGAAKWSDNQLDEGTKKTLDALKSGEKASSEELDSWWKSIGHGIDDLGHKL